MSLSKLLFIFSFLLCSSSFASVKEKCEQMKSDQNPDKFICYGINVSPDVSEKLKDVKSINTSLQEWLWLNEKLEESIAENVDKVKILNDTRYAFQDSIAGYPNEKKFSENFRMVENYKTKYEELYEASKQESRVQELIDNCIGIFGGKTCNKDKLNDLNIRLVKHQASKLTILMSYPLLSSAVLKESTESDVADFLDFRLENRKSPDKIVEFEKKTKKSKAKKFSTLMLKGIGEIDEAMEKRDKKWRKFQQKYNRVGLQSFINDKQKSGVAPRHRKATIERIQREETGIMNEILLGVDLNKELNNPYLGKAICQINQRQESELLREDRNQMTLDVALMVAPFFLGPLGVAARLASLGRAATMGRVANLVGKGKYLASASVEAGLIGYDGYDVSKKSAECQSNYLRSLNQFCKALSDQRIPNSSNLYSMI